MQLSAQAKNLGLWMPAFLSVSHPLSIRLYLDGSDQGNPLDAWNQPAGIKTAPAPMQAL